MREYRVKEVIYIIIYVGIARSYRPSKLESTEKEMHSLMMNSGIYGKWKEQRGANRI
jgi:hypothetical protein